MNTRQNSVNNGILKGVQTDLCLPVNISVSTTQFNNCFTIPRFCWFGVQSCLSESWDRDRKGILIFWAARFDVESSRFPVFLPSLPAPLSSPPLSPGLVRIIPGPEKAGSIFWSRGLPPLEGRIWSRCCCECTCCRWGISCCAKAVYAPVSMGACPGRSSVAEERPWYTPCSELWSYRRQSVCFISLSLRSKSAAYRSIPHTVWCRRKSWRHPKGLDSS